MRVRFSGAEWALVIVLFLLAVGSVTFFVMIFYLLRLQVPSPAVAPVTVAPAQATLGALRGMGTLSPTSTLSPTKQSGPAEILSTSTPMINLMATPTSTDQAGLGMQTSLKEWSLEQKIGQMLIISFNDEIKESPGCALVNELHPAGVIFHPNNVDSPEQFYRFASSLQDCAKTAGLPPLLIVLNHEGEYINRFDYQVTMFPAALALGATGNPDYAYEMGLAAGRELAFSGANMVLGPVADVLTDYDNYVIAVRSFSGDPVQAAAFTAAAVQGYEASGMISVLKHFPGHGGVSADSHEELPVDMANMERLKEVYLPPFRQGLAAGAQVVMLGHLAFPNITGDNLPATYSPQLIDLLRTELAFDGVVMSDDMEMKAITRMISLETASLRAVQSGLDLLLITRPGQARSVYWRLLNAARTGTLSTERVDEAVRRVLALKASHGLQSFPLQRPAEPDWQADADLAVEIGERAVTLFPNHTAGIPIPSTARRLLVIGPEKDWEFYPVLGKALQEAGHEVDFEYFTTPVKKPVPETSLLETLPAKAATYDQVIVFTWHSHVNRFGILDEWQPKLVKAVLATQPNLVVVALRSPADLIDFPQVPGYLATFGTTRGQRQALLEILLGKMEPVGVNPLPELK